MNRMKPIERRCVLAILIAGCCLAFSGCEYEVPITAKPTRKVDERFLGAWTAQDAENNKTIKMKVARLDDFNYVVCYDGDLCRAYHSDVANTPFVSVQILESAKPKYAYSAWQLADDGTLIGRVVNDKLVPDETKDSSTVQKLLEKNLQNPALFVSELRFKKD